LSFAQRIKGTLPEPLQALISIEKEKDIPDFKYKDESTPFSAEGKEMAGLIRRKAPDSEIAAIFESVEQQARGSGLPEPGLVPTDAFVTSICFVGSKSLSHVLSCIERCKDRLLAIGAVAPTLRRQIISSVMDYWCFQKGVGINIVDKLLNYTILSPTSVVEWTLVEHAERGTILSEAWAYELISTTLGKVTGRVRQIVGALRRPGLPDDQVALLRETLEREMGDMKSLFGLVEDSLVGFRDGNQDMMMEADSQSGREVALIGTWVQRWARVFQRKYAVEESWIKEELAKPLPELEPEEVKEVKMEEVKGERHVNGQNGLGGGGHELDTDGIE
jgi:nuclear cap-binding protein subunit 1